MTADACAALVAHATACGFAQMAHDYPPSYRDNDRLVLDDRALADHLYSRLASLLPQALHDADGSQWLLCGLNERFRYCRYHDGQGFRIHQDGAHAVGHSLRSRLTLQIYLDDDPERRGGRTRFYQSRQGGDLMAVEPRVGRAIIFDHALWHDGEPVTRGQKHVLRTDVMYRRVQGRCGATAVDEGVPQQARSDALDGGVPAPVAWIDAHSGYVFAAARLADGRLVTGGRDRAIRIWADALDGRGLQLRGTLGGHSASIVALLPEPSLNAGDSPWLLSASRDHTVWMHDLHAGTSRLWLRLPAAALSLAAIGSRRVAVGTADGRIHVCTADASGAAQLQAVIAAHRGWVWALAAQPDGTWASGGEDGDICIWHGDARGDVPSVRHAGGHGPVHALTWLTDGRLAAGCADGTLLLLRRVADGSGLVVDAAWPAHRGELYCVTQLGNRTLATGGEDGTVRVFALETGECVGCVQHGGFVRTVVALDGARMVSGSYDGRIGVCTWDGADARLAAATAAQAGARVERK